MSSLLELAQGLGAFVVGLAARLGVVALFAGLLVLPFAAILLVARLVRDVAPLARGLRRVGGVLFNPGARYAPGHTWVERDGARLRVGVDGVAQELLPWALGVELPEAGALLEEGQVAAVIACGGVEAPIVAPVAGKVVAVNSDLRRDPSLVKRDAFGRGWLFVLEPVDARWSTLPAGDAARAWTESEAKRLDRFLELRLGRDVLALRSGPAPATLAGADWRALTHAFLQA